MDMPTRCADCPMRNSVKRNITICHPTIKELDDNEYYEKKPDWCPLKPMPSKKPTIGKESENDILCMNAGYNSCIDELLKGEEG